MSHHPLAAQDPTAEARNWGIAWSGMTHVGRVRKNNEDTFLALASDGRQVSFLGKVGEARADNSDFVFAVSDGMGGARSGEFASRIAVDKITKLMPRGFRLTAAGLSSGFNDIMGELFGNIHRDLLQLGASYEECRGMGATLSLCWFAPGWMYFGHIGDSRIYYLPKEGPMRQVTHDHSHVGWLQRQGKISEREARSHPRKNALQQALGAGHQFLEPHMGAIGYQPGDRFVICSDGLVDGLWDRRIEEIVRTENAVAGLARRLVEEAVSASGRDNTTALSIEVLA
jgi:protein phosphatase